MEPNTTVQILENGLWINAIFIKISENNQYIIQIGEKITEFNTGNFNYTNNGPFID